MKHLPFLDVRTCRSVCCLVFLIVLRINALFILNKLCTIKYSCALNFNFCDIMEVWLMWYTVTWFIQVQTFKMNICMLQVHSTDFHKPWTGRANYYFGRPIVQVNCDNLCFWNSHAETLGHCNVSLSKLVAHNCLLHVYNLSVNSFVYF